MIMESAFTVQAIHAWGGEAVNALTIRAAAHRRL
jgi:hypothetical protein